MSICERLAARHECPVRAPPAETGSESSEIRFEPTARSALCERRTFAQIRFGIELLTDTARRIQLSDWVTNQLRPMFEDRVLNLTENVMLRWRLLIEAGRKKGHTFSEPNILIAATAIHHGLTLVSRDTTEYELAGATVINPWKKG